MDTLKTRAGDLFWYQHTVIDSCSRMRVLSFVEGSDAQTARRAFEQSAQRFPFAIAAMTHDNGSENGGMFSRLLEEQGILQFWSRPGTPTDNPRVERSHRCDDDEFYAVEKHVRDNFQTLVASGNRWERTYNTIRPHQALGYLTPMEFVELWRTDPPRAQAILGRWNRYLSKQSLKQRAARKEKNEAKIRALNDHLQAVLGTEFTHLTV